MRVPRLSLVAGGVVAHLATVACDHPRSVATPEARPTMDAPCGAEAADVADRLAAGCAASVESLGVREAAAAPEAADPARRASVRRRLRSSEAMTALFRAESAEAQTLGVIVASGRVALARDLPPDVAVFVVDAAFVDLFGVFSPLGGDADDDLVAVRENRWIAYLAMAAAVAHHPVPDDVHEPGAREAMAWSGVLAGIAERLLLVAAALPAEKVELREGARRIALALARGRCAAFTPPQPPRPSARAAHAPHATP
jgi:hypothetical protein